MLTDRPPRAKARRLEYERSDEMSELPLPADERFQRPARAIEAALAAEDRRAVQSACSDFIAEVGRFYGTPGATVKVLAARPKRVYKDGGTTELYGDYDPETCQIRVWMRTAVQRRVTSFGTFFSTLCHEFCHHLDMTKLGFPSTPHTRGFYARTACLYHHARATPYRVLHWRRRPGGQYQIDWAATNRSRPGRNRRPST